MIYSNFKQISKLFQKSSNYSKSFSTLSNNKLIIKQSQYTRTLITYYQILKPNNSLNINKMPKPLNSSHINVYEPVSVVVAEYSTSVEQPEEKLNKKQKLKRVFKDYGATVIIFHIGMSLCSLGLWYLIVSSGIDVSALLQKIGIDKTKLNLATGASTFVVAYALHKLTAPIRISITLGASPFIVAYLRRIGILKSKKVVEPLIKSKAGEASATSGEIKVVKEQSTSDKS